MRGPVPPSGAFWAKLRRSASGEVLEWHPFADHCLDVALAAELLLHLPNNRARLERLAGRPLTTVDLARLAYIAGLHDIGKLARRFQIRAWKEQPGGHTEPGLQALCELDALAPRLLSQLNSWGDESAFSLWWAAICHHGRLVGTDEVRPIDKSDWSPREQGDPTEALAELLVLLRRAFPQVDDSADPLPDEPAFHHAFAGLVMLADWLGSDTSLCPYSEPGDADRITTVRANLNRHAQKAALDARPWRARLSDSVTFRDLVGGKDWAPRGAQAVMQELPLPEQGGSISLIEAETGSGKTEAALLWWARLYQAGKVDGLYFALPLRAAATQLHQRVHVAARSLFGDEAPPVTLAVPGYLRVDSREGRPLPGFQVLWNDQAPRDPRTWAAEHPKRFLASAIAVGTIDQVLLSALPLPHAHLRGAAVLRSLLVIDEVHASDRYMERLLLEVLQRFRLAGGHVLLLSATLGESARQRIFRQPKMSLSAAVDTPYPRVWIEKQRRLSSSETPHTHDARQKTVRLRLTADEIRADRVAAFAVHEARAGKKVLVIVNRVARCQAIHAEASRLLGPEAPELLLDVNGICAPHHSRYAREDRKLLDAAIEARFGKGSTGPALVIATQTVEQSLDIDADLLITDLCPMDVLLQRIGRLHRHQERGLAPCVVLSPTEAELVERAEELNLGRQVPTSHAQGLGTVYTDLCGLIATRRLIASDPEWQIPLDNRRLVEAATHRDAMEAIAGENDALQEAWTREHGAGAARQSLASIRRLDWTKELPPEAGFPSRREAGQAERLSTRWEDSEDDRLAPVDPPWISPLGGHVKEIRVPDFMCRGHDPEVVERRDDALVIGVGERRLLYGTAGLGVEDPVST